MKNQAAAIALSDYLAALEAMAVSQPATSLAGCMVQVALMNHMFNSCDPDPSVSDFSNQEATRRFEIAVYSVIGALSRETGRDPKTLGNATADDSFLVFRVPD
jgi:hypothetical protein